MTKPTIGRVLWYWPTKHDIDRGMVSGNEQALAAIVAHVWGDTCVNLVVFDANGNGHPRTSVLLAQEGDKRPAAGFAEWMPYQKTQAAITAAVEKQVAALIGSTEPETIEQEIQRKGLTAPRVTQADVYANIDGEYYFTADKAVQACLDDQDELTRLTGAHVELKLLTFCVLRLKNGFTVTGESACASPENYDAEIGRKIAYKNAVEKIWPLMGYELRSRLAVRQ